MGSSGGEHRKHVRLPGKGSSAREFSGGSSERLPEQAVVADVSEGGVGLRFAWPVGTPFPVESGDGMGFMLRLEGSQEQFEVLSIVRHVARRPGEAATRVGVEFTGLQGALREALKKAVLDLAVTSLRSWRPARGQAAAAAAAGDGPAPAGDGQAAAPSASAEQPEEAGPPIPRVSEKRRKLYLGEVLVKQGVLDGEQLKSFLTTQFSGRRRLGEELTAKGLIDEEALAKALAEQGRLTYVDLDREKPDPTLAVKLGQARDVLIKHWCLPFREVEGVLIVVMSSPPGLEAFEAIREAVGRRVRVAIAAEDKLATWLKRTYNMQGEPRPVHLRFPMQIHVEYRFLSADWKKPVDAAPSVGITREASHNHLVVAGPLPSGVTPESITGQGLTMAVRAQCPELEEPMAMGCRPIKIEKSDYPGEYVIEVRIEKFPREGELAWARLCMLRGTIRFHPGAGIS